MSIAPNDALRLLRWMLLAREGDRREGILLRQGKGHFQLPGEGHEAIAALAFHLTQDDLLVPAYRDRALVHALGITVEELARDFLAREGGPSLGRNLPGHFSSRKCNIYSISSPVGSQCLPAVGAAWGMKRSGSPGIVFCHIGDAATRQGEFYEAFCFAMEHSLPVLFVVEDNGYGISTPTVDQLPFSFNMFPAERIQRVNGRLVEEVDCLAMDLVERVRSGGGPLIMWCDVDRLTPHTLSDDQRIYRSAETLREMESRDPLVRFAETLVGRCVLSESDWESMQETVRQEIRDTYSRIEALPLPSNPIEEHLFGGLPDTIPAPPASVENSADLTMVQAVQFSLTRALKSSPDVLVFGEDVEDPKGGVFGLTKGLSTAFPDRVVNSPLAEATILGVAVGMAAIGHRPIFEFQFVDFIGPAFNQIVSQLSNLRWRTGGDWKCPAIFYAPCGAYLPAGGMWHSQSGEGLLSHIPGVRAVMPSTPEETVAAFWTALHLDDPTFILLPKHLFHVAQSVRLSHTSACGKARVIRPGGDVTLVCWGNTVSLAEEAVGKAGVNAEILDLNWVMPWDREAVEQSIGKTGRLVIVQEDIKTGSLGASILATLMSEPDQFYKLTASPRLISRLDTPVPFSPDLELALLPSVDLVAKVLAEVVSE